MQKTEIINKPKYKSVVLYDEMSSSYLSYAMSVIISRALPDVRDGLKPVHRRIIYAMYKGGFDWSKSFRKSARIVGDVIGKYHPHGDQAVYDALVRMVQTFSMSLPLIDGQGNFGSIDGDAPAAMRYTETKLAKISQYLINDIEKNTVEFKSNYDEKEKEPEEKTRLRRFLREKDLKKHLKGKSNIGDVVKEENEEESQVEKEEASINEDLVKDNQLQHAVSLLSGWEVMKKVFKNLQVPIPEPDSRISMH